MDLFSAFRRGVCALALALPLAAPPCAYGEDPPAADGPPAARDDTATGAPVVLPEQVVRLPRAQATDATSAATVVEADRFAGEAKAVAELVATAPGVSVREQGGLGQLATVSIRGASASGVKVLLDGLPLDTAAGGGVDLSRIPLHWVSSLEIVRGAEGARFGAGALGGVVNVVTRPAGGESWSAVAGGGSFRTYTVGADASTGGEGWGLASALSLDGTRGDFPYDHDELPDAGGGVISRTRKQNSAGSGGLLVKGFVRRGEGRWDALVQASGGEREIPGPPRQDSDPYLDRQRDGRVAVVVRHARPGPLGSLTTGTLSLRADGLDLDAASSLFETRQRGQEGSLQLTASGQAGPVWLEAGVSSGAERLTATGLGEARARAEGAAWAAAEIPLLSGRLRLAPAVRAEAVGPYRGVSAKLGASAPLVGPVSVRASAGRTFRPPSFSELYLSQALLRPNPDLRPERAVSVDAGVVAQGSLALASLSLFLSRYDDLVIYQQLSLNTFGPRNDARALVRGVEAEVATAPAGPLGLSVQGAATLQQTRTLRGTPDELGKELPRKPGLRLFARVAAECGPFEAHAELHHLGSQWTDAEETGSVPPATTGNVGLSVRLRREPDLRVNLEVRNVLDVRTLQDGFENPLPGRMVMLTLRAGSPTR